MVKVYCDGGSRGNPGPAAVAFVIYDETGNLREKRGKSFDFAQGKYLGVATNNEAEYRAVIEALSWIKNHLSGLSTSEVHFFLDSNLVVNQLDGLFKVKESRLRALLWQVRRKEQELGDLTIVYSYIPREQNRVADALVNESLDSLA